MGAYFQGWAAGAAVRIKSTLYLPSLWCWWLGQGRQGRQGRDNCRQETGEGRPGRPGRPSGPLNKARLGLGWDGARIPGTIASLDWGDGPNRMAGVCFEDFECCSPAKTQQTVTSRLTTAQSARLGLSVVAETLSRYRYRLSAAYKDGSSVFFLVGFFVGSDDLDEAYNLELMRSHDGNFRRFSCSK